jgi:hypothetical protein
MGLRYFLFRIQFEFLRRSGLLAKRFPVNPPVVKSPSLESALESLKAWPWQAREVFSFTRNPELGLEKEAKDILSGKILLFNSIPFQLQNQDDWLRHPETGFVYDNQLHWTRIPDMNSNAGDIKYVWERSRFGYFQTIMRFDYHFEKDNSEWIFSEIESWIRMNPINCGPNYRCSQEISLRILNWLGAISFYRNSPALTSARWDKIFHHMYWQAHHVRQNIHFSRIAVRNNHAITETLLLYIFGSLFPDLPGAREWAVSGKNWFEEEVLYQIYPDGSYVQFSMNYHRVVAQLLTLAFRFAEGFSDSYKPEVANRAAKTLGFLEFFQDPVSGFLSNYGANDGALFFKFSSSDFLDYRPQLEALGKALGRKEPASLEETCWFGSGKNQLAEIPKTITKGFQVFPDGGFAGIRTPDSLLLFRSSRHKDRPAQGDNHHLDFWYKGQNILLDAGTFKYNSTPEDIQYFFGTASHNTARIAGMEQMKKGPRFVWLYWSQSLNLEGKEQDGNFLLEGKITAFRQIREGIFHQRKIKMSGMEPEIWVEDDFEGLKGEEIEVIWHPGPGFFPDFQIEVRDLNNHLVFPEKKNGWYSGTYGQKKPTEYQVFRTPTSKLITRIFSAGISNQ